MGPDTQAASTAPVVESPGYVVPDSQAAFQQVGPPASMHDGAPRVTTSSADQIGGLGSPSQSGGLETPAPLDGLGSTTTAAPVISPELNPPPLTSAPQENTITAQSTEIPPLDPGSSAETLDTTPPVTPAITGPSDGLFPSGPTENLAPPAPASFEIPPISPTTASAPTEISTALNTTSPTSEANTATTASLDASGSTDSGLPVSVELNSAPDSLSNGIAESSPEPASPDNDETSAADSAAQSSFETTVTQPAPTTEDAVIEPVSDEPLTTPSSDTLSTPQATLDTEASSATTETEEPLTPITTAAEQSAENSDNTDLMSQIDAIAKNAWDNPSKLEEAIKQAGNNPQELLKAAAFIEFVAKTAQASENTSLPTDPLPVTSTS